MKKEKDIEKAKTLVDILKTVYTKDQLDDLCTYMDIIFWYDTEVPPELLLDKTFMLCYQFLDNLKHLLLDMPFEDLPLHINDANFYYWEIKVVNWRLMQGK